jgi:hypothetical protein
MRNSKVFGRFLLSGYGAVVILCVDHIADFTDAFGALRLGLTMGEHGLRRAGPGMDGPVNIFFTQAIAVADVHFT